MRFGGYRKLWDSDVEGQNGEAAFTSWLRATIPANPCVLDVGCGDGIYTLHMSSLAHHITGIDYAPTMIDLARRYQQSAAIQNVRFLVQRANERLPFADGELDLIYSRRGSCSHLTDGRRALRRGGLVAGIHSGSREEIVGRIEEAGYRILRNEEFSAVEVIPTLPEFALFLSRIPGSPDYTDPQYRTELEAKARDVKTDKGYVVPFWRFVWVATNE